MEPSEGSSASVEEGPEAVCQWMGSRATLGRTIKSSAVGVRGENTMTTRRTAVAFDGYWGHGCHFQHRPIIHEERQENARDSGGPCELERTGGHTVFSEAAMSRVFLRGLEPSIVQEGIY